jgi:hypothetical protein
MTAALSYLAHDFREPLLGLWTILGVHIFSY